jgi:hypothetical protein
MHNKRRQNNMGGNGGQHRHHNNRPRRFTNNRPNSEGGTDPASIARTRRNATQNREKYQMMAHDATRAGDRVQAEYYLQHAEHYYRVLAELPPEEVRQQHFQQRNNQGDGTQNGDQPQGDGLQAHDGNGHGHNHTHGSNPNEPMQQSPQGLPSFITQSSAPSNPEE